MRTLTAQQAGEKTTSSFGLSIGPPAIPHGCVSKRFRGDTTRQATFTPTSSVPPCSLSCSFGSHGTRRCVSRHCSILHISHVCGATRRGSRLIRSSSTYSLSWLLGVCSRRLCFTHFFVTHILYFECVCMHACTLQSRGDGGSTDTAHAQTWALCDYCSIIAIQLAAFVPTVHFLHRCVWCGCRRQHWFHFAADNEHVGCYSRRMWCSFC
jgi:hypothetical protein